MDRTLQATLRYHRGDLKWAVLATALLGLFGEASGVFVAVLGEKEAASLLVLGILLGGGVLVNMICAIVDLFTYFPVLLAFSATRRGLGAGLALHCLLFTALQVGTAFLWGTASALAWGRATGLAADWPWRWIPGPVWLLLLLAPTLLGLFFGGIVQRFGQRMGVVLYLLFLVSCGTASSWMPALAHRLPAVGVWPLALGGLVLALVLGLAGFRFLLRTSVQ